MFTYLEKYNIWRDQTSQPSALYLLLLLETEWELPLLWNVVIYSKWYATYVYYPLDNKPISRHYPTHFRDEKLRPWEPSNYTHTAIMETEYKFWSCKYPNLYLPVNRSIFPNSLLGCLKSE